MRAGQLVAFKLRTQGPGVGCQLGAGTVGVSGQDLRVGVEAGRWYGKVLPKLEHQELQAVALSLVEKLFAGAVVAKDDDSDVASVGVASCVGALVGYRPSLPDPARPVDDIVVADIGPALLALVIALNSQDLPGGSPF